MDVEVPMNLENIQWRPVVAKYARPDLWRSIWQVVNSLVPYVVLFYLSMRSLEISFWLTLPLSILTAGFMVRIFIIFHDCGHGSFFKSREANKWLGRITGFLVFTPYQRWTHDHAMHHATAGNLDKRGRGDVYTMTVQEYLEAPWWKKFGYRVMRQPIFMFIFGSLIVFIGTQRVPPKKGKREITSTWTTNLALALWVTGMSLLFGWKAYVIVQLLVIFFGASVDFEEQPVISLIGGKVKIHQAVIIDIAGSYPSSVVVIQVFNNIKFFSICNCICEMDVGVIWFKKREKLFWWSLKETTGSEQ